MDDAARSPGGAAFPAGGGSMAALIREHDWQATALGPAEGWPRSLRTILDIMLPSPVPMVLLWGDDGIMLYNDAYSVFAGGRHPALLGSKVREGWPEVTGFNDNVMRVGLAGGTLHYRDQELTLHRHGRPEQVWMNLDYSPVPGDGGEPAGVLCILAETTGQVVAECRRDAAEAALRAERDRSQGVLDNMGEAFVLLDRAFRFVDMNAEAMRLEQRPKQAVLGRTHWEAHPDAAPELGELYRRAMRERRAVDLEHRYVWPDGRDTWIDMRAYPVEGGLAVFYRDVTDRRRAEEAVRASDDRQRFLIALDDGVRGLASPAAVVAATSRALGERLGATRVAFVEIDEARDRATILGGWTDGTVAQLPDELRLSGFGATLVGLLRAGETVRVDDAARDPRMADGIASLDAIDARAIVSVPLVKDRRFVLNLNVHRCESHAWTEAEVELIEAVAERTHGAVERVRAEAALRASETRHRETLEIETVAIGYFDMMGGITDANDAFLRLIGYTREELQAGEVRYENLTPPDWAWRDEQTIRELLATGHGGPSEKEYVRRDGSRIWILCASKMLDERTAVEFVIDVTEPKAVEEALRRSEARLAFLDRLGAETAPLAEAGAVLRATTRLLGEHLGVSICAYADMDEDQDGFTIRGDWAAAGSRSIVGHYSLADFGTLAVANLSAGLPLVVGDVARELAPGEAATFQAIGISATICMPLVKEGRLAALMAIHDRAPRAWTADELALLREVTARSWAHVERVGAIAELRDSEKQFRAFAQAVPSHVWAARPDGSL